MAFLRLDGYAVDALVDGFELSDASIEGYSRVANDSFEGITYSEKKTISFDTPPLAEDEAVALEGWIRGEQHLWLFSRSYTVNGAATVGFTRNSSDAGLTLSSASAYASTASLLWAAQPYNLAMGSSGSIFSSATAAFGSEGDWTIHGYHNCTGSSWTSWGIRSRAGTVQHFLSGASSGSLPFVNYTTASGYLGMALYAAQQGSTTRATSQYAAVSMSRFAWDDDMLTSLATVTYGLPSTGFVRKPYLVVTGDGLQTRRRVPCNGAGERGPMIVKGFVETFDVQPVVVDGVFRYNARALRIRLVEK